MNRQQFAGEEFSMGHGRGSSRMQQVQQGPPVPAEGDGEEPIGQRAQEKGVGTYNCFQHFVFLD